MPWYKLLQEHQYTYNTTANYTVQDAVTAVINSVAPLKIKTGEETDWSTIYM